MQNVTRGPVPAPEPKRPAQETKSAHDTIFIKGGSVGILLVHSLGGSPAELRYVANNIARAGYTVICPLLSGHGQSPEVLRDSGWSAWYASIADAHDELRRHCSTIIVGGLSAGGVMTLRLAAERPHQIAGIALFAPTLWPNGWAVPWYFDFMKLFLHKWSANRLFLAERSPYGLKDERLRNLVISSVENPAAGGRRLGFYGGTIMEFRWMVAAVKSSLASVRQPTLIIHPREDDRSSLTNAATIAQRLGGPVDITVLTDSYHMCTLDRQRDQVIDRTLGFIRQTVAAIAAAEKAPRKRTANE